MGDLRIRFQQEWENAAVLLKPQLVVTPRPTHSDLGRRFAYLFQYLLRNRARVRGLVKMSLMVTEKFPDKPVGVKISRQKPVSLDIFEKYLFFLT